MAPSCCSHVAGRRVLPNLLPLPCEASQGSDGSNLAMNPVGHLGGVSVSSARGSGLSPALEEYS